jgi:hypothetical protein
MKTTYPDIAKEVQYLIKRLENSLSFSDKFVPFNDGNMVPMSNMYLRSSSNEGSFLYMMIMPDMQEHYGLNITEGVTSKFVCEGVVSAFVDTYVNGDSDIKKKLCEYYTVHDSLADQARRGTDFMADTMFDFSAIKMLELHVSSEGTMTNTLIPWWWRTK